MTTKAKMLREFYSCCRATMCVDDAVAQTEGYVTTICDDEAEANRLFEEVGLPGRPVAQEEPSPKIEQDRRRRIRGRINARNRAEVMKSLGLTRTRSGGWE